MPWEPNARRMVLLAPSRAEVPGFFQQVAVGPKQHRGYLSSLQRMRGEAYLEDGAIRHADLDRKGRHVQPIDPLSWHLVSVNQDQQVLSCARFRRCPEGLTYNEMGASKSALARDPKWAGKLQHGLEAKLRQGQREGFVVAETGGWAVAPELRGSTEALRIVLSMYALGACFGRSIAICTATTRHGSASMLRRIGAQPLDCNGEPLPPYFDPAYGCEMEILLFDSAAVLDKYRAKTDECKALLRKTPVLCATAESSLFQLAVHLLPDYAAERMCAAAAR